MKDRAIGLKHGRMPQKHTLYRLERERTVIVEEPQQDGSCDRVALVVALGDGVQLYFCHEYLSKMTGNRRATDIFAVTQSKNGETLHGWVFDLKGSVGQERRTWDLINQLIDSSENADSDFGCPPEKQRIGYFVRRYQKEALEGIVSQRQKELEQERKKAAGNASLMLTVNRKLGEKQKKLEHLRRFLRDEIKVLDGVYPLERYDLIQQGEAYTCTFTISEQ